MGDLESRFTEPIHVVSLDNVIDSGCRICLEAVYDYIYIDSEYTPCVLYRVNKVEEIRDGHAYATLTNQGVLRLNTPERKQGIKKFIDLIAYLKENKIIPKSVRFQGEKE